MTTAYPGGIDNFTNPTSTDTLSSATVPHASEHANANDAIKAIETELGTNPKGSYASVSARLAASTGSITTWRKAAAGGETSLSGTDDFSTTLAYTVGQEQVFINGVLLERGVDYTATTGSSITGLTALVASDIATVISVGSFDVANAIPLSTVTTKGDLIAATGASTVANVGVGADGTTLVANSSASTGVSWSAYGSPNYAINGGMDIWQRSTSSSTNANYGSADRWWLYYGAGTCTVSQETSVVPTGFRYAAKLTQSSTSTTNLQFNQSIETNNSIPMAGKTVTLSGYVAATASTAIYIALNYSTSTDVANSGSWTAITPASGSNTLTIGTTTYQRIVATYSVPSNAQSLQIQMGTTSIASGTSIYITGVQLEIASAATPFRRAGGTLQGELSACRRYLPAFAGPSGAYIGYAYASNAAIYTIPFDVPARVAPTGITVAGTINALALNTQYSVTPTFDSAGATEGCLGVSSGLTITAGQGSRLNLSTSALILFTGCEL